MKPEKYAHLKLQLLPNEYQYVLFENPRQLSEAIAVLGEEGTDFCAFSFQGESSLICPSYSNVLGIKKQNGWAALKIVGDMPFGTVQGLIASISTSLYTEGLGVCIISTYLSDLFLIKKEKIDHARKLLKYAGWEIIE